jgi:hypothetical protein
VLLRPVERLVSDKFREMTIKNKYCIVSKEISTPSTTSKKNLAEG